MLAKHDENYMPPELKGMHKANMIPELGHFALILVFTLALMLGAIPLIGAARGYQAWMRASFSLAAGVAVFAALSFGCLVYAFVTDDFSVRYAATNSNSLLPLYYKVAAVWGAHEGSFLLWILIASLWTLAVATFSRHLPLTMISRVLAVMGWLAAGFAAFSLFTSNPFERALPIAPTEGSDLNPLLQDFGLTIHPPILYAGYVGFSVAFAFALAALDDRPSRCSMGALVASLDERCLGIPQRRHRARQLVGVLRTRLGRLVVLGSGGERFVHAVVDGYRPRALVSGY